MSKFQGLALLGALAGALGLSACGTPSSAEPDAGLDAAPPEPSQALFSLPADAAEQGFYSLPYPNDLRLDADGFVDLEGHLRPNSLLGLYMDVIEEKQQGFSLNGGLFLRFSAPIDESTLPTEPIRSMIQGASVYLVNIDTDSDEYGKRTPLVYGFHADENSMIGPNWLGVLPYPGFVLEEDTTYALVATDRLMALDGSPVSAAVEFVALREERSSSGAAQEVYAPLWAWLDEPGDDERENVVSAAVFTTQHATDLMGRFREVIESEVDIPEARNVRWIKETNDYVLYIGRYDSPMFQAGEYPFKNADRGGYFVLGEDGLPELQGTNNLRFAITLPTGTMPAEGWPIALYAHGTGGDYRSFESDGTGRALAQEGIATISIDQVMHGDRLDNGDAQTLFFNFQNPYSTRTNIIQAGLEDFQLVRLAENFDFTERHVGGRTIRFDPEKIFFFGHSQGSQTGVGFVAHEPKIKAAIFSGAGSLLYKTLLTKTKPFDIAGALSVIIRDVPLDEFHPAMSLLQGFFEPSDALTYARLLSETPPANNEAKNVFVPIGMGDSYTPVPTINALVTALGADLVAPQLEEIEGLELREARVLSAPISNNRGPNTAVAAQYDPASDRDGHFVSFHVSAAQKQNTMFFKSFVDNGAATVVRP